MTVETTISLDADLYRAIEERVGPEGVDDFVSATLSKVLAMGDRASRSDSPEADRASADYFEAFTERDRTIAEMAACTRKRLAVLRKAVQRSDFPPGI